MLELTPLSRSIDGHRLINLSGHYFIDNFNEDSVLVDLGGYMGHFSHQFLERYPLSRVILIEPNPDAADHCLTRFIGNSSIEVIRAAIGPHRKEREKFYVNDDNTKASTLLETLWHKCGCNSKCHSIHVAVITLNEILQMIPSKTIDLLKVDIEGSEWDLIRNISKEQARHIKQISIEFHDFADPSLRRETEHSIHALHDLGFSSLSWHSCHMHGSPFMDALFWRGDKMPTGV